MSAKAIGLFIAAAALLPAADKITFTETIAPIIYQNCVTCHRPGEAAPFALISYEDVKKRGALIATVTKSRYMPPWHAAHGYGEFADERRLTDAQITAIGDWVSQGMPQGDMAKMPKLPQFPKVGIWASPTSCSKCPPASTCPPAAPIFIAIS